MKIFKVAVFLFFLWFASAVTDCSKNDTYDCYRNDPLHPICMIKNKKI